MILVISRNQHSSWEIGRPRKRDTRQKPGVEPVMLSPAG